MALIDVSELLSDPDFVDEITIIRRKSIVNDNGENILSEQKFQTVASVQGNKSESLRKDEDRAILSDLITVYCKCKLYPESKNGYSDIIIWKCSRFEVYEVTEDFQNYGNGFTKAYCRRLRVSA